MSARIWLALAAAAWTAAPCWGAGKNCFKHGDHEMCDEAQTPPPQASSEKESARKPKDAGDVQFLTDEEFDRSVDDLGQDLAREHSTESLAIKANLQRMHDFYHSGSHRSRSRRGTLYAQASLPPGRVAVTAEDLALLKDNVDVSYDLAEAQRRGGNPLEIAKLEKRKQDQMRRFMGENYKLHEAFHAAFYDNGRGGRSGLEGLPPEFQKWHNQELIRRQPGDPFGYVFGGNAALSSGSPATAKAMAEQALSLDPKNAEGFSLRAAAEMDLKEFAAANADAKRALELDPSDKRSQAVVMLAHEGAAGRFEVKAAAGGGPAAQRDGEEAEEGALGRSYGFGDPGLGAASSISRGALQAGVLARQADRAMAMGDYEAAISQAGRAIDLEPRNADAYALRAMAEARDGRPQEALKDSLAALVLDPKSQRALDARASALNRLGRFQDGLSAADAAAANSPRDSYAQYQRAMALNGLRDRKGVIAALGQAAALDPRYQTALETARAASPDQDLAFLFPEEELAAAKAALAVDARGRGARPGLAGLAAVILGCGLLLFGFLHLLWGALSSGRVLKRLVRRGPAVGTGETTAALPTPPPLARTLFSGALLGGQYRRLGQIGSSVVGAVYEGIDHSLDRRVALRKLRVDMRAADRERLLAPVRAAAGLNHPGLAALYGVVEEGETLYLVSEFAQGRTLRDALASRGPLPAEEALPFFRGVAEALDYVHSRGVVHGAVKASNIMIGPDGAAKILDCGVARGPGDAAEDRRAMAACMRETLAGLPPAQLDALDATLTRARAGWRCAADIVDTFEAAIQSSTT